jgi:hypothetical protein
MVWILVGVAGCVPRPRAWPSCTVFPVRINWGPSVAMDGSQIIDLLSRTHTCLWEWEGSLLSCRGFRLFPNWLIGGGEREDLSTVLRPGLMGGGLESKFGRGPRPFDRSGMSWSCLCLGYKWGVCVCFRGTQLGYIDSWIAVSTWRYDLAMV